MTKLPSKRGRDSALVVWTKPDYFPNIWTNQDLPSQWYSIFGQNKTLVEISAGKFEKSIFFDNYSISCSIHGPFVFPISRIYLNCPKGTTVKPCPGPSRPGPISHQFNRHLATSDVLTTYGPICPVPNLENGGMIYNNYEPSSQQPPHSLLSASESMNSKILTCYDRTQFCWRTLNTIELILWYG